MAGNFERCFFACPLSELYSQNNFAIIRNVLYFHPAHREDAYSKTAETLGKQENNSLPPVPPRKGPQYIKMYLATKFLWEWMPEN